MFRPKQVASINKGRAPLAPVKVQKKNFILENRMKAGQMIRKASVADKPRAPLYSSQNRLNNMTTKSVKNPSLSAYQGT